MLRIFQLPLAHAAGKTFSLHPSSYRVVQAGSVSRIRLVAKVIGKGSAECELVRHLAPITSTILLKGLPVQDRVHWFEDKFVYIETGMVIGAEKQKMQFKRGDMALMPSNGAICFVLKDCVIPPMNPVGKILKNIESIEGVQTGDVVSVKRAIA
jgi:uncharacterized protein